MDVSHHALHASFLMNMTSWNESDLHPSRSKRTLYTAKSATIVDAAVPRSNFFDTWNSSSTGHQRAENRLSGSSLWRDSRNIKLGDQFRGGLSGGVKKVVDMVGAGSEGYGKDGRRPNGTWEKGAKELRTADQRSLVELWDTSKTGKVEEKQSLRTQKIVLCSENAKETNVDRGDCKLFHSLVACLLYEVLLEQFAND